MKKFGIVFNHDKKEYSVYPIDNESSALENIKSYQKVARVDLTIWRVADMEEALQAARKMNEPRHYLEVPMYFQYGMGEYFVAKI
jgi:hypothetical protein